MSKEITLARPDLAVPAVHDGRHKIDDRPFVRESVPYMVILPDAGITFFTQCWVDHGGDAGAMLAIFGPAIGPEPLNLRLANRQVPSDMNFSDWRIDSFRMEQDLKFRHARVRWESEEASLDLSFEAIHPPYQYSTNARGCPPYAATDRIEQSGWVNGRLVVRGKEYRFDTTGHRDHSWGRRDWRAMQHYKWFMGQARPDVAVHFWQLNALGNTELRGYVAKDGLMAEVTAVKVEWHHDKAFRPSSYSALVHDEAGRETSITAEVFAHFPLVFDPAVVLNESGGRGTIDGEQGVAWLEMCWSAEYVDHILSSGLY